MILKPHGEGYVYDEIERHLEFRYVTATEACWRIFGFWQQKKSHSVTRLSLHEEGKHTVYYNSEEPEPPDPSDTKDTHLLAYFALCQKYTTAGEYIQPAGCARRVPNPNTLLFTEIPQHFRWDRKKHKWRRRLNSRIGLGRLPYVSPAKGELYHLHTLLCKVPGASSWTFLKTANGVLYPTFKATCIALGLHLDNKEAELTLKEAVDLKMPRACRQIFATLLTYNTPSDPHALWMKYKARLCDDFVHKGRSQEEAEQLAFWLINKICLQQHSDVDVAVLLEVDYEPLPFQLDFYQSRNQPNPKKAQEELDRRPAGMCVYMLNPCICIYVL
jgi:hypothetical protein